MKIAFTMVEVIFVIVILGVLSAYAIPKLGGISDDAKASTTIANLEIFKRELAQYYAMNDTLPNQTFTNDSLKKLTNISDIELDNTPNQPPKFYLKIKNNEKCISINILNDYQMEFSAYKDSNKISKTCKTVLKIASLNGLLNNDGTSKIETLGGGSIYDTSTITIKP